MREFMLKLVFEIACGATRLLAIVGIVPLATVLATLVAFALHIFSTWE